MPGRSGLSAPQQCPAWSESESETSARGDAGRRPPRGVRIMRLALRRGHPDHTPAQTYRRVSMKSQVADVMTATVVTARESTTFKKLAELMGRTRVNAVPV